MALSMTNLMVAQSSTQTQPRQQPQQQQQNQQKTETNSQGSANRQATGDKVRGRQAVPLLERRLWNAAAGAVIGAGHSRRQARRDNRQQ
jgi:hypothetical protein